MSNRSTLSLVNCDGRKYLTCEERSRFIEAVRLHKRPEVQTFALMLVYSGCRISEALAVRISDIGIGEANVRIRTLKRRKETWREVPLPEFFVRELELVHQLRKFAADSKMKDDRLWPFSRASASRFIAELMKQAGIRGPQACTKGLRHAFGITAVENGVPLPIIAAILGHSQITTTAIYTTAVGKEAREFVKRMW